jgi:hypothetical protein
MFVIERKCKVKLNRQIQSTPSSKDLCMIMLFNKYCLTKSPIEGDRAFIQNSEYAVSMEYKNSSQFQISSSSNYLFSKDFRNGEQSIDMLLRLYSLCYDRRGHNSNQ